MKQKKTEESIKSIEGKIGKNNINRNFKDSVFRLLFSDKARLLELFNALEGTDYKCTDNIAVETLEAALYNQIINDLAFRVGDHYIILVEHQSGLNENMPLRMLFYFSRVMEKIVDLEKLHGRRLYQIPTPSFYVFYNGLENRPAQWTLKLSTAYRVEKEAVQLELKVIVININLTEGAELLQKCESLNGYSVLIQEVRDNEVSGMERSEAIAAAIKTCIDKDVLKEFLKREGSEVANRMFRERTVEDEIRFQKGESWEEGRTEGLRETAKQMKKKGFPLELIAELTGLALEDIEKIE